MARVKSVTPVGEAPVYDIEVPYTHNFVANGMVVHNCHRVAADQFSSVCFNVPAKLRLGLSATPERQDGKEFVLHAHIGPIRVKTKVLAMLPKVLVYTPDWECPA
jgi:superfamily II DNA or RNA helicase